MFSFSVHMNFQILQATARTIECMEKPTICSWIQWCTKLCLCNRRIRPRWHSTNCWRVPTEQSMLQIFVQNWIQNRRTSTISPIYSIHSIFQNHPNVDNRFDPNDNMANNIPAGFFGVQTASFSSSSDVNGKKSHKEGASTTVNDNGKVTTFKVEN